MGNTNSVASTEELFKAVKSNNVQKVQELLDKGADINAKDKNGRTPLHYAIRDGHTEIVHRLIENGANINAKNKDGWSPLHYAAKKGYTEIVHRLIENGANINAQNEADCTPLHFAAFWGRTEVAKLLIEKGVDVNAKDNFGYTHLHLAAYQGHIEIIKLLIEKGADVNIENEDSDTSLYLILNRERLRNDQQICQALETRFYQDYEIVVQKDIARLTTLQEARNIVGFDDFKEKILCHMDSYQSERNHLNTILNHINFQLDETKINAIIHETFAQVEQRQLHQVQQQQSEASKEIIQAEVERLGARPKGSMVVVKQSETGCKPFVEKQTKKDEFYKGGASDFTQQQPTTSTSQSQYETLATDTSKKSSAIEEEKPLTKLQEQLAILKSLEPLPKIEINQEQVTEQMQASGAIPKKVKEKQLSI